MISKNDKYDYGGLKIVFSIDGIMRSYLCIAQVWLRVTKENELRYDCAIVAFLAIVDQKWEIWYPYGRKA